MAIMGTHGIKLEKLADMRKYCKPDFRQSKLNDEAKCGKKQGTEGN